jgi:hypothetical protein
MNIVLERISHPLTPTNKLRKYLQANNLEYATGGREKSLLVASTIVWKISCDGVLEALVGCTFRFCARKLAGKDNKIESLASLNLLADICRAVLGKSICYPALA